MFSPAKRYLLTPIQHGLLSGDALIVAMMQKNGLTQLASNDTDFDHVAGITRFGPA